MLCSNDGPRLTDLDLFYGKVNFTNKDIYMGKGKNNGYFRKQSTVFN